MGVGSGPCGSWNFFSIVWNSIAFSEDGQRVTLRGIKGFDNKVVGASSHGLTCP